ncbi:hypothetical protein [Paraburkholderia sp. C35]|uniref:hypothetical protein n=1 Tax=Paraburkholderia sp. C35 TaxID=2126993 RepID=UPI000D69202D|nr:hypothetical protein [Paraburkholderia sp. C35]
MKINRLATTFARFKAPVIILASGSTALGLAWMQTHCTNPANPLNRLFTFLFQPDAVIALPFLAFILLIAGTYREPQERQPVSNDHD